MAKLSRPLNYPSSICFYEEYFYSLDPYLEELLACAARPRSACNWRTDHSRGSKLKWSGGLTLDQALNLAVNGWPEGASKLVEGLEFLKKFTHSAPLPTRG